jgi:hypothetical protein
MFYLSAKSPFQDKIALITAIIAACPQQGEDKGDGE